MKYKTSELVGEALNQAVANASAEAAGVISYADYCGMWEYGGPIIEREGIELWKWKGDDGAYWCAHVGGRRIDSADKESIGDTPLVAAMRAFVTAKLGAEVDL